MEPKVSIILPVYNRANTINDTIESVMQQSYKNFELIIVDDGSKDNSQQICRKYELKDNRIKLIKKENGGPSQARNVGLKIAKGKYLMFIDSDDKYKADMIEKMVTEIERRNSDIVVCNFNNRSNIKEFYNQTLEKGIEKLQINYLFNPLWNKIYILNIIKENNIKFFEKIERGEDYRFNIDYFRYINKITYISESLYIYNVQMDSLTKKTRENEFELSISNLEYNIGMLLEKNIEVSNFFKEQYCKIAKETIFSLMKLKKNRIEIKEKIKYIRKFLQQDNILKEDLLKQKIHMITKENALIRNLLKNEKYNFLIIYSILRNKMKNIKSKWVDYERKK